MLTGKLPMEEAESKDMLRKMLKRSFGAIKPIAEHQYAPDEDLCQIVEKMMKVDLKARYQTMDDIVAELGRYRAALEEGVKLGRIASPAGEGAQGDAEFDSLFSFPSESGAPSDAAEKPQELAPAEMKTLPSKTILCVETQTEIQDALRKTLAKLGYRVLLVTDAERAAERYRESPVDAVIFDTDGLGVDAFEAISDMHEKAHEDEHSLQAIVLLGPRQDALRDKLPVDDRLIVLSKPIKMKQVQDAIQQLLPPT